MRLIFYFTDNEISQKVADCFLQQAENIQKKHINSFKIADHMMPGDPIPVFYGILRGCGSAMWALKNMGIDYLYIDNGYFKAKYIDTDKKKDLSGRYRIVKSEMVQVHNVSPVRREKGKGVICLMPPSAYSASMYNTTPEDWAHKQTHKLRDYGYNFFIRDKNSKNYLEDDLKICDGIYAFNSMATMRASELHKPVFDSYGLFRNDEDLETFSYYDAHNLREYYADKQFTLGEIAKGEAICQIRILLQS